MFPELAEELRPGQRSLVAGHLGPEGLHEGRRPGGRDAEEPFDVAAREEGPVEVFELADGVGDGEEPPRLGRHPWQSSPADEQAAAQQRERPRSVHLGEHSESPTDAHAGPDGRVYVRLDGRAGDRGAGSQPDGDAHRLQAYDGHRGPGLYRPDAGVMAQVPEGLDEPDVGRDPGEPSDEGDLVGGEAHHAAGGVMRRGGRLEGEEEEKHQDRDPSGQSSSPAGAAVLGRRRGARRSWSIRCACTSWDDFQRTCLSTG